MSLTITESGHALTETIQGVTMPADYTFATINDFVHRHDTNYEDLQYLCLGMASHIEKLQATPDCNTCANGRGRVNGLSQESFCSQCIYDERWKQNHYQPTGQN